MVSETLFIAICKSLCPACRQGLIFYTFTKMHSHCPVCGTYYEREHGYFLVAIFFGYVLNGLLFAPFILYGYFTEQLPQIILLIVIADLILMVPTFHYSRVLWMYLDQMFDPRRDSDIELDSVSHS